MENVSKSQAQCKHLVDIQKTCFLIDLPRLPEGQKTDPGKLPLFASELLYFLKAMNLDDSVLESIRRFDFSRTQSLAFVHSM